MKKGLGLHTVATVLAETIVMAPLDGTNEEPMVTAYPNPFSGTITLKVLNVASTTASDEVSLFSLDGRLRYCRKLSLNNNPLVLLEDLPDLEQGVYFLKTVIDGKQFIIKMAKR